MHIGFNCSANGIAKPRFQLNLHSCLNNGLTSLSSDLFNCTTSRGLILPLPLQLLTIQALQITNFFYVCSEVDPLEILIVFASAAPATMLFLASIGCLIYLDGNANHRFNVAELPLASCGMSLVTSTNVKLPLGSSRLK